MICGRKTSVTSDLYCDVVGGNVVGDVQDESRDSTMARRIHALAAVRHMTCG